MIMEAIDDIVFVVVEWFISLSYLTTTQLGFIVFSIMVFGGIAIVIGPKSKGRTESFRETLRHDKKPAIGLFVVLPIFVIGYIWAFTLIF